MKSSNSLITIGLISFNAKATICAAIESAISQSYINTEIIIVDDFSSDGTWKLILNNYNNHPNIRLFRNSCNLGVAYSRNFIIKEARGFYLAFFDDDDISDITRLEIQLKRIHLYNISLNSPSSPVFCYSSRLKTYSNSNSVIYKSPCNDLNNINCFGSNIVNFLLFSKSSFLFKGSYATCTLMAKVDDFKSCGYFDNSFRRCEDTEFAIRAALNDAHFIGVSRPLVFQTFFLNDHKTLSNEYRYIKKMIIKHNNLFPSKKHFFFSLYWNRIKYLLLQKKFLKSFTCILFLFIFDPILFSTRFLYFLPNLFYNYFKMLNEND